jgi:hypothetical protein
MRRLSLVFALLAFPAVAHADRRAFTNTYEYDTLTDNDTEVELYSDQARTKLDGHAFELAAEVEHGITDRWEVALYHVFDQTTTDAFHFDRMQLETRYRFADRGDWPVDVELYGEATKGFGTGGDRYLGEGKLIVSRDIDKITAVVNLIGERQFGRDATDKAFEAGFAGGLTYEIAPELKVGAESWGQVTGTRTIYAGPAISWAPSTSLWATITPGMRVDDFATRDYDVRLAIGLHVE